MSFNLIESLQKRSNNETFIWLCNIGAERFWHNQFKILHDKFDMGVTNAIEEINLLLCKKQDTIILRNMPNPEYLKAAEQYGFETPNIICPENKDENKSISELILQDERILNILKNVQNESVYFIPYAVTYLEEQIAQICGLALIGSDSETCRKLNDKIYHRKIAEILRLPMTEGLICTGLDDILPNYLNMITANNGLPIKVVLKSPYNCAGKGMYIAESEKQIKSIVSILKRTEASGEWILEKWYDKKIDINFQIFISPDGTIDLLSINRQFVNGTVYTGTMYPSGLEQKILEQLELYSYEIGQYLFSDGYTGMVGIDSIITENCVIPIIEINARFTLSTYLSFLNHHFREKYILFQFFDIAPKAPISYRDLYDLVKKVMGSRANVFLFAPTLLPKQEKVYNDRYRGRIFVLFYENDYESILNSKDKFKERVVKRLNEYYGR